MSTASKPLPNAGYLCGHCGYTHWLDSAIGRAHRFLEVEPPEPDTLGPCGCVDYHVADCPTLTERYAPVAKPDLDDYLGFQR
jgi:hypothetical protein